MSKKQSVKKKSEAEIAITPEEADELQMIVDRLAVQNPEGESFERYLQTLGNALSGRPHLAAALVEKLSRNPNATGFLTFQALEDIIENSSHKRRLRQAAYRFSQRGFASEPGETAPKTVVLIQGESRNPASHLLLVPGTLWLVSALIPETGPVPYSLVTAFIEDDYDTFNVKIAEGNQKFYREYLQKVAVHAVGNKPVEIPLWHAARLFFEMYDLWAAKSARAEVEHGRKLFLRYHEPDRKPYVYELMPPVDEPARYLPEISFADLAEGMDLSWLRFGQDDLVTLREKLKQLESPVLVVPREVQVERSQALVRAAADTLCGGRSRFLFRRFFEEQAMALKLAGAEEKARWAWILARHLDSESDAGENPAVVQIILLSLKHYWPEDFETRHAHGHGGLEEHQHPPERRTESGIILL